MLNNLKYTLDVNFINLIIVCVTCESVASYRSLSTLTFHTLLLPSRLLNRGCYTTQYLAGGERFCEGSVPSKVPAFAAESRFWAHCLANACGATAAESCAHCLAVAIKWIWAARC